MEIKLLQKIAVGMIMCYRLATMMYYYNILAGYPKEPHYVITSHQFIQDSLTPTNIDHRIILMLEAYHILLCIRIYSRLI